MFSQFIVFLYESVCVGEQVWSYHEECPVIISFTPVLITPSTCPHNKLLAW